MFSHEKALKLGVTFAADWNVRPHFLPRYVVRKQCMIGGKDRKLCWANEGKIVMFANCALDPDSLPDEKIGWIDRNICVLVGCYEHCQSFPFGCDERRLYEEMI